MNSRAKGKTGELQLAKFLRGHGYAQARRGVQYSGGSNSPDVVGLPGVHIEVKRVENGNPYVWLDQAIADSSADRVPVVFHRRNGRDWIVILRADDFITLYRGY